MRYWIIDQAPRLQRAVEATKKEDTAIAKSISAALELFSSEEGIDNHGDIRNAVLEVLMALARHRQKGADLIYDAYAVDIGGY